MLNQGFLDPIPLWGMVFLTVVLTLISLEGGFHWGRYLASKPGVDEKAAAAVNGLFAPILGLLALILAFTFGAATERYGRRSAAMLEESNAIGTTYLRADMLPEPARAQARALLREYVDIRIKGVETGQIAPVLKRSDEIHRELWTMAKGLTAQPPAPAITTLYIGALNEVINFHARRVSAAVYSRIPAEIWIVLGFVLVLAVFQLGISSGLSKRRRIVMFLPLLLCFAAVLVLVVDMERPGEGAITVNQSTFYDLQKSMRAGEP